MTKKDERVQTLSSTIPFTAEGSSISWFAHSLFLFPLASLCMVPFLTKIRRVSSSLSRSRPSLLSVPLPSLTGFFLCDNDALIDVLTLFTLAFSHVSTLLVGHSLHRAYLAASCFSLVRSDVSSKQCGHFCFIERYRVQTHKECELGCPGAHGFEVGEITEAWE